MVPPAVLAHYHLGEALGLHQFDLAGMLIEAGGWEQLKLSAIAVEDQIIPLTRGRAHIRHVGDLLHPEREPIEELETLKAAMGSLTFAAQYQQDPTSGGPARKIVP